MEKAKELVAALHQQALKNQHCDVKIIAHGKVYGAHRGVLVQASTYFKKLFSGSFRESHSGELSFTEIVEDTDMFEAILEYIYLGSLDFEVHAPEDVLQVASLLLLDDLVLSCRQMLLERLTLDNVLHTWSWAHLYNLKPLEEVCKALCRSRFHDTIIHQPDTMRLPVDFLCHIITEGVLGFVDGSAKLIFLQTWLHQNTRDGLMETMDRISSELKEAEPNVASALEEPDFLDKHFQKTETPLGQVDCIIRLSSTLNSINTDCKTTTLNVCDLETGKWYESSAITPPEGFLKDCGTADQSILLFNHKMDELYAFHNKTKTGTHLSIPTYSFKDSIFKLGDFYYMFITMPGRALPSMDDCMCETNTAESMRTEGNSKGCSLHDEGPSHEGPLVDTSTEVKGNTDNKAPQFPPLCLEDLKSLESQLMTVFMGSILTEEHQIDLTLLNKHNVKYCLFRLDTGSSCQQEVVSSVPSCQNGRPRWKLISEEDSIAPDLMLRLHKKREIGGKLYFMAYGSVRSSANGEGSKKDGQDQEQGPFWFCVETLSDTNQGARVVRLPDPPERRTQRSRGVNWSQVKLVEIKGCFGLRSFKSPVKYSIYFDASDWRWKWVSYKMEFDVDKNNSKQAGPSSTKLPIKLKKTGSYQLYGPHYPLRNTHGDKSDRSICSSSYYPLISQLWSYETEDAEWRELHPPPCGLGGSQWQRARVSKALLRSLDAIKPRLTVTDGKQTESEHGKGPFADFEFVVEES